MEHRCTGDGLEARIGAPAKIKADVVLLQEVPRRSGPERLKRRAYSPVLRAAELPPTPIPWWGGRTMQFEYA